MILSHSPDNSDADILQCYLFSEHRCNVKRGAMASNGAPAAHRAKVIKTPAVQKRPAARVKARPAAAEASAVRPPPAERPSPAHLQRPSMTPRRLQGQIWYASDCSGLDAGAFGLSNATAFRHWFASEINAEHRKVFSLLHPGCEILYESAECKDIKALKAERDRSPDHIFIYTAGFPCEPFSQQGLKLGSTDSRAACIWSILQTIHSLSPTIFLLENVPTLVRDFPEHFNDIINMSTKLAGNGYHIDYKVLDSRLYGNVPATRNRLYIVGIRKDCLARKWDWPGELPIPSLESILQQGLAKQEYGSLSTTQLKTLHKAVGMVQQQGRKPMQEAWVIDLGNSAGYSSGPVLDRLPTVTKSHAGSIWLMHMQRFLSPAELLLCQGIRPEQLSCRVQDLPAKTLARMCGNAFTATVIQRILQELLRALQA